MFDNDDLKSLASQATELNSLIQQVSRHTDQVRQHRSEARYFELLVERVGLASRKSQELFDLITAHLRAGKSIRSLGDTIQLGAAELILRTMVPRQFTNGQHPFDYCNVAAATKTTPKS